jgi:uncharacterized protein YyaL (SSP411 family)
MSKKGNRLAEEASPYLLQHAYNPVDWFPWGEEALARARDRNQPILLSIGYSACHWCHVMEHESFENEAIADLMNKYFVCIKLDREERPDIDQIYMEAIQAMGIPGGWPLNVFLTPEQKPFYGGTYFPPERWAMLLNNIAKAFQENRAALEGSAQKFGEALNVSLVDKYGLRPTKGDSDLLDKAIGTLTSSFDQQHGGTEKAPKFPMPVIWNFLLHYCAKYNRPDLDDQLFLTLDKMAQGGLYDQIGGGFARYSVDEKWFAPHFEKMLYDNAQLISLYANSYAYSQKDLYRKTVYQTIEFLQRELQSPNGAFYSALDADSEGVEGKYYVWDYHDFVNAVGADGELLADFFGLTPEGNWEQSQNILHCDLSVQEFTSEHNLNMTWFENITAEQREKLLLLRNKRTPPGLDNKIICGWNGLMIKALADAYAVFDEDRFLQLAVDCADFIEKEMRDGDQLFRIYRTKGAPTPAFLEDYACLISGYLQLYQVTFNEKWLYSAQNLMSYVFKNFYDEKDHLFYYTGESNQSLIARKKELFDNVIPSSNSIMAMNLWTMGTILDRNSYLETCKEMLSRVVQLIPNDPAYLSNWATVLSFLEFNPAEVVIGGPNAEDFRKVIAAHFHPHKIILGSVQESSLPLLKNRVDPEHTMTYVCYNKTCQLPTTDPATAIQQLTY